eukprot:GDKI01004495.1.p1 GENE.GDKI01004495.1~~GDKI01004495.1.p1  ORF type:complete len:193 (+),score=53.72 GDKI01004495.1:86-664(+)
MVLLRKIAAAFFCLSALSHVSAIEQCEFAIDDISCGADTTFNPVDIQFTRETWSSGTDTRKFIKVVGTALTASQAYALNPTIENPFSTTVPKAMVQWQPYQHIRSVEFRFKDQVCGPNMLSEKLKIADNTDLLAYGVTGMEQAVKGIVVEDLSNAVFGSENCNIDFNGLICTNQHQLLQAVRRRVGQAGWCV